MPALFIRTYDTIVRINTSETKTALLQAAKRLVLERGYAGASVRELAAASGTNLGAVNYHFGSRENLLNEAILEFFLEWGERVGDVDIDPTAGPLQQLAARARPMIDGIAGVDPAVGELELAAQAPCRIESRPLGVTLRPMCTRGIVSGSLVLSDVEPAVV